MGRDFSIKLLYFIAFISAPIAIFSGLALTPLFILLGISCTYICFKRGKIAIPPHHPSVPSSCGILKESAQDLSGSCAIFVNKNPQDDGGFLKVMGGEAIPIAFKIFLALLVWGLLSSIWSVDPIKSAILSGKLIALTFLGIISVNAFNSLKKKEKSALSAAIFFGIFFAVSLILIELQGSGIITKYIREIIGQESSFEIHYMNRGACYLAVLFWVLLACFSDNKWKKALPLTRWIAIWIAIFSVLLMLESLSAIVAFASGAIVFLTIILSRGYLTKVISFGTIGLMLFFLSYVSTSNITGLSPDNIPESAMHRLYIWDFTAEKALEKPLIGWGLHSSRAIPGGSEKIAIDGKVINDTWVWLPLHPHSNILQIFLELGVIGVTLFMAFIVAIFHSLKSLPLTHQAASMSVVVSYIAIGMTAFGVWQEWWISAGFLLAVIMIAFIQESVLIEEKAIDSAAN